ncbi:fatty-acyl coenzyme A oxidase [Massospora cicadina]|nr:fatty-acyl coenzyme A oxidase [Massospora cicadina]
MSDKAQRRLKQLKDHVDPPSPSVSLNEERSSPSFPIDELTHFLNGGKKITELKNKIMLQFERDPTWKLSDQPNLSLAEIRERTLNKARSLINYLASEPANVFKLRMEVISYVDPAFYTRFGVHAGLFLGAIQGQATPNQLEYWIQKGAITLNGVTGCFAMTELGHGSNVAGLETTATFDEASDEFIIHTPTLTATKWWIGGAAQTATHSAVYAQLIVKGKCYGVKTFMVPLRNPIAGRKMGRDGIDNGYIQFTHVRIPRSYMLMKHTQVTRTGQVKEPPLAQLTYGALIGGRVSMVVDSATFSRKALTIAIRYGAIRRQFSSTPGKLETKLLDYAIHQHRLLPLLAQSFALHFAAKAVADLNKSLQDQVESLSKGTSDQAAVLDSLKEVHATSAGLKAFGTWATLSLIEECRQTLGGHGYSAYTGLSSMYQDFAIQCTWEGDNTILTLQLGRYLVACYRQFKMTNGTLSPGIQYMALPSSSPFSSSASADEVCDSSALACAWGVVAAAAVRQATHEFEKATHVGLSTDEAYERCSVERLKAAKMHYHAFTLNKFVEGVSNAPISLQPILQQLCQLYACHVTIENASEFLAASYFSASQMQEIRIRVMKLCQALRPQAVNLVDSFGFSDYVINSPLGRYDGDIYRAYFDLVRQNNPHQPRPPYFKSILKPILTATYEDLEGPDIEIDEAIASQEEDLILKDEVDPPVPAVGRPHSE